MKLKKLPFIGYIVYEKYKPIFFIFIIDIPKPIQKLLHFINIVFSIIENTEEEIVLIKKLLNLDYSYKKSREYLHENRKKISLSLYKYIIENDILLKIKHDQLIN